MSLYGSITSSSNDLTSRLQQLTSQVDQLEKDERFVRGKLGRGSFNKRCSELIKQVETQRSRIDGMKESEVRWDRREDLKQNFDQLWYRINTLAPDRDRSSSRSSNTIERSPSPSRAPQQRRKSMYDDAVESEESEDDEPDHIKESSPPPRQVEPRTIMVGQEKQETEEEDEEKEEDEGPKPLSVYQTQPGTSQDTSVQPTKKPPIMVAKEKVVATTEMIESVNEVDGNRFIVLADLAPEEKHDLRIKKGEVILVIQTRSDGWWTAMNDRGRKGLVPKTFLRHLTMDEEKRIRISVNTMAVTNMALEAVDFGEKTAETKDEKREPVRQPESIEAERTEVAPISVRTDVLAPTPMTVRCLGDAYRVDRHLSMECHLAPRLSVSHLQFHDLIWDWKDDKVRRRSLRISRVIRFARLESMPKEHHECCLVRVALYDFGTKTGRQIVSNVHTIRAKSDGKGTWNFIPRTDTAHSSVEFAEFIVRSNYSSTDVLLMMEASVVKVKDDGSFEEKSLGILKMRLTDDKGAPVLTNKTYSEILYSENIFDKSQQGYRTPYKMIYKVLDVPKEIEQFVDSMPDILLFNPMFVRIIYWYRRRTGTILCRDRNNSFSSEMISDPLLALFPSIADQPDLMDLLRTLWLTRFKHIKNKPEAELAKEFFQIFMNTAFCIHKTAVMPEYLIFDKNGLIERQKVMNKCVEIFKDHKSGARFLSVHPCRPLNIFDYSMDLLGPHALD